MSVIQKINLVALALFAILIAFLVYSVYNSDPVDLLFRAHPYQGISPTQSGPQPVPFHNFGATKGTIIYVTLDAKAVKKILAEEDYVPVLTKDGHAIGAFGFLQYDNTTSGAYSEVVFTIHVAKKQVVLPMEYPSEAVLALAEQRAIGLVYRIWLDSESSLNYGREILCLDKHLMKGGSHFWTPWLPAGSYRKTYYWAGGAFKVDEIVGTQAKPILEARIKVGTSWYWSIKSIYNVIMGSSSFGDLLRLTASHVIFKSPALIRLTAPKKLAGRHYERNQNPLIEMFTVSDPTFYRWREDFPNNFGFKVFDPELKALNPEPFYVQVNDGGQFVMYPPWNLHPNIFPKLD